MSDILRKNRSCWYELSWSLAIPGVILRIHKDFVRVFKPYSKKMMELYNTEFGLENFSYDFKVGIGYDRVIKYLGEKHDFLEFECALPFFLKLLDEVCDKCNGLGKSDSNFDDECFDCSGTGKKIEYLHKDVLKIGASLSIFSRSLRFPENDTYCSQSQLLEFNIGSGQTEKESFIGGSFSPTMVKWLRSLGNEPLMCVTEATTLAYRHINVLKATYDRNDFDAEVRDGEVFIKCPGDRTLIHPYPSAGINTCDNEGYEFSSHNVFSFQQQWTLLVGLSALHDRARKEIQQ